MALRATRSPTTSFGAVEPADGERVDPGRDRRRRHAGGRVRSGGTAGRLRRRVLRPVLPADPRRRRPDRRRVRGPAGGRRPAERPLRPPGGRGRDRVARRRAARACSMRVAGPSRLARARGAVARTPSSSSLDFETTGLDFARDTIVSFGVVPVRGGRVVLARGASHQLIDPHVPPSPSLADDPRAPSAGSRRVAAAGSGAASAPRGALDGRYLLVWFADVEVNFLSTIFGGSAARGAAARSTCGTWRSRRTGRRARRASDARLRAHVRRPAGWGVPGREPARRARRRARDGAARSWSWPAAARRAPSPPCGDLVRWAAGARLAPRRRA